MARCETYSVAWLGTRSLLWQSVVAMLAYVQPRVCTLQYTNASDADAFACRNRLGLYVAVACLVRRHLIVSFAGLLRRGAASRCLASSLAVARVRLSGGTYSIDHAVGGASRTASVPADLYAAGTNLDSRRPRAS